MTNRTDDLIAIATAMRKSQSKAKRTIQAKRSCDAKSLAATKGINHQKFPTYYKYG